MANSDVQSVPLNADDGATEQFRVSASDDETYNTGETENDLWQPAASVVAELYTKIAKDGRLTLEWQSPGRISPSELLQASTANGSGDQDNSATNNTTSSAVQPSAAEATIESFGDFDFDDDIVEASPTKVGPLMKKKPVQGKLATWLNAIVDFRRFRFQNTWLF